MGALVKLPVSLVRVAFGLVEIVVVTLFRLPGALWNFFFLGLDFFLGRWVMRGGELHCPIGHAVPTEGTYTCTTCSFTYRGSPWVCRNPECRARTPFVDCPECGLSCRNPYRFGRP